MSFLMILSASCTLRKKIWSSTTENFNNSSNLINPPPTRFIIILTVTIPYRHFKESLTDNKKIIFQNICLTANIPQKF
jgi:hypothetical protein